MSQQQRHWLGLLDKEGLPQAPKRFSGSWPAPLGFGLISVAPVQGEPMKSWVWGMCTSSKVPSKSKPACLGEAPQLGWTAWAHRGEADVK